MRRDFDLGRAEARSPEAWQYRRLRLPPRLDAQPTGPFFRIVREVDPDPRKADSALGARLQRGQRLDGAADFVREPPRCGGGIIEPRCHVPARFDEFEGGFLRPENAAQKGLERIALFFAQTAGTADRRLQRLAEPVLSHRHVHRLPGPRIAHGDVAIRQDDARLGARAPSGAVSRRDRPAGGPVHRSFGNSVDICLPQTVVGGLDRQLQRETLGLVA